MEEFNVEIVKDGIVLKYRVISLGETFRYIIVYGEIKTNIFYDSKQNKWKYLKGSPKLPDIASERGKAIWGQTV